MHEWTICKAIIKQLEQQAATNHFTQVKKINLQLGELSCIDQQVLAFNFSIISQQTIAAQAVLQFSLVMPKAKCLQCKNQYSTKTLHSLCPACGSSDTELLQGQELTIQSIEVESCA